jgi:hypothetical protein
MEMTDYFPFPFCFLAARAQRFQYLAIRSCIADFAHFLCPRGQKNKKEVIFPGSSSL